MRPTSIKDIARLANVSHSTVSRALRDSPLVNHETAAEIRRLADKMGYRLSAAARSLVTQRTDTIGVVVTTIADPFAAGVVEGIEEAANEHGLSVLLANSNADPERELRVVRTLEERRVDGIIVTASRVGALYIPELERMQVPIVLLNNQHPGEFAHSVMIANTEASEALAGHLIGLGHRQIAYLGDRFGRESDAERFEGFRRALTAAGLKLEKRFVVHGDGRPEGGHEAMARLLEGPRRPTAVFCYNDMSALGALLAIREAGLRVPADISVTGFDDLYLAQYTEPPLTTVRQPMRRMGRLALETLIQLLAGDRTKRNLKVPGELIIRGSTAAPQRKL
ncbi:MAG: LacI family transcriptional regulator [Bryobacteraceae bacterium]|nr:LacI family transcriptional regulator [Bryobacteraceae bacterium]